MPAQARAFALALTAGVACALVYGALRRLRRAAKAGAWLTGLIDLLFWAIAALLTSLACALGDVAGLRLYMLLGVLCGFLFWEAGVRRAACALFGVLRRKNTPERICHGGR